MCHVGVWQKGLFSPNGETNELARSTLLSYTRQTTVDETAWIQIKLASTP